MKVIYKDDCTAILCGNCNDLKYSRGVDAVVTDPPYGLSFMGKDWDYGIPGVSFWETIKDAMKPGASLVAFGGTRTHHRLMCAIEDAGFEIRDTLMWVYGSGFPKSLNVSKAIDSQKLTGKSNSVSLSKSEKIRPIVGEVKRTVSSNRVASDGKGEHGVLANRERFHNYETKNISVTGSFTDEAKEWEGWGTALKPAWEPIILARKPLSEKTVAANVLKHGTGALNIDACRVEGEKPSVPEAEFHKHKFSGDSTNIGIGYGTGRTGKMSDNTKGRFPANLIHDGSEEVVELFPETKSGRSNNDDDGSAARFFYCAKASKSERGEGNNHPTVKPLALMRYLCRLITPPGGVILDPFVGSGSTLLAARSEGFKSIGIDIDPQYCDIAVNRWKTR